MKRGVGELPRTGERSSQIPAPSGRLWVEVLLHPGHLNPQRSGEQSAGRPLLLQSRLVCWDLGLSVHRWDGGLVNTGPEGPRTWNLLDPQGKERGTLWTREKRPGFQKRGGVKQHQQTCRGSEDTEREGQGVLALMEALWTVVPCWRSNTRRSWKRCGSRKALICVTAGRRRCWWESADQVDVMEGSQAQRRPRAQPP